MTLDSETYERRNASMDDRDERIASVFDAEEIPEVSCETLKIW
jgi:hypothetical protein